MISVVILTYNRLTDLCDAVESVGRSRGPGREIIVVDNGSPEGISQAISAIPQIRTLRFDGGVELAVARNGGIDAARGDIIAFTDDDCIVAEDWLERIAKDLDSCDAVGGIVKLHGEMRMPWWWDEELNWMPGLSVPGLYGPLAGEVFLPQSANLAYRAPVLRKLRFTEDFGGIWMKNMTREDSDLWQRTRAGGYRTTIDTGLVVYHKLPRSRFTLRFCVGRAFSDGFAAYHREEGARLWKEKLGFLAGEPFRMFRRRLRREGGSRVHEAFWMIRESGFVYAHLARPWTR